MRTADPLGRRGRLPTSTLTSARQGAGLLVAALALPALTAGLVAYRGSLALGSVLLLFLGVVVAVAIVGGALPALLAAVAAVALVNWFFVPPFHTFVIDDRDNVLTLAVFVVVVLAVSTLVELQARGARAAAALAEEAARVERLAAVDRLRSALLAAVGHDLRTPLAAIKASVSGLRDPGVRWSDEQRAELLAAADESADHLGEVVANLLDASRLQAGALSVRLSPVALDEVVSRALLSVPRRAVVVDVSEDLPLVLADAGLLERVVANLVDNARRYSPSDRPAEVLATESAGNVLLQVRDHGPGVPESERGGMFAAFQRLGDRGPGVGLGLAVSRGFTEAMGGRLEPADTPGGGLTMTVSLPRAAAAASREPVSGTAG